jgi:hypothetical protein
LKTDWKNISKYREMRNAYNRMARKKKKKRPLGRPMYR